MAGYKCPQCGAPIDPGMSECRYCGEKLAPQPAYPQQPAYGQPPVYGQPMYPQQPVYPQQPMYPQQPVYGQPQVNIYTQAAPMYNPGVNPSWPLKDKLVAGLLGIFLGGIGVHKFYLGKVGLGIVYILFCWTGIPAIVGLIEGIIYLCSDDRSFEMSNHVRVR